MNPFRYLRTPPLLAQCVLLLSLLSLLACGKKEEAPAAAPVAVMAESKPAAPPLEEMEKKKDARAAASGALGDVINESVAPPPPPKPAAPSTAQISSGMFADNPGNDSQRKFIRTANLEFQVKDVYAAALGIEDAVASHGGFVLKNDINSEVRRQQAHAISNGKKLELTEYLVRGSLLVRVPSAKTQDFLRALLTHMVFLNQRKFEARDAQFDLLRQQLEYRRNQESQLDLGQVSKDAPTARVMQKAEVVNERNHAKAARDQALVMQKEFEDQVALSTIELTIYQPPQVRQSEAVDVEALFQQNQPGFFQRAGNAVRHGYASLLEFAIEILTIWPFCLLLIALAWGYRRWQNKRAKKAAIA